MAEPPVLAGAVQARSIWNCPLAVAASPVGAPGAVLMEVELLVTAGTPDMPVVKEATSLPAESWSATVSSPVVGSV